MTAVVPAPVSRVLAKHGPVHFAVSGQGERGADTLSVAPLDELLVIFVSFRSPLLAALRGGVDARVSAIAEDGSYALRCRGRAVMTGRVMAHPRRMEFVHWLPEDKRSENLVAIEFIPEHIDFTRQDESGEEERFKGETRAPARPHTLRRWTTAAFAGLLPALTAAVVIDWGWIGWFGEEYRLRAVCLLLSLLGTFALLGGGRLLYRAAALRRFQVGRVRRPAAGVLADGWLPHNRVVRGGVQALGVGVAALLTVGWIWGWQVVVAVLVASQLWFFVPLWLIHLSQAEPEPDA